MTLVLVPLTTALLSQADFTISGQEMEAERSDVCLSLSVYPDPSDRCSLFWMTPQASTSLELSPGYTVAAVVTAGVCRLASSCGSSFERRPTVSFPHLLLQSVDEA